MRVRIQPYNMASISAAALSRESEALRVRLVRTRFRPRGGDRVVNWGSSRSLFPDECYLNLPSSVATASCKLASLREMAEAEVTVPAFTTNQETAQRWADNGHVVVCRTLLNSSAGKGVVLVGREIYDGDFTGRVPRAALYTRYVPKFDEYRVHVWGGDVLDVQQKRLRNGLEEGEFSTRIRSSKKGWVYCRENVDCPDEVLRQSVNAVEALRLDFGAVDVGWTRNTGRATVYEVNTAPGLEGTTLQKYAQRVRSIGIV